ncbi:AAA family ATPase [Arenimonas sp.]|uniref:AAA family ATPase n=1 Tax=Arenimonas sp. TaxID=1872635 RepID=UPI0035B4750C
MNRYEAAKQRLAGLVAETRNLPAYNEATARFQIIDVILTEVLCWDRQGISVEKFDRGEFTDYECGTPVSLLVEAKRESIGFSLPLGVDAGPMKLSTLAEGNPAFESALNQAIRYCKDRSIPYAAVTNGKQWAFFLGARTDNVAPIDGRCIAYPSLEVMLERFRELWDLFTPEAVSERNPTSLLAKESLPPPPIKLSGRIPDYPGFKNRNPIATELQILGGLFFDDIVNEPELEEEFLRSAYCQSGALSQYALVSRDLLRTRYTTFFESQAGVAVAPATTKKGTNPQLTADVLAAALSKRPILLVGDVGVGKTTFIRNLIKNEAKEELSRALVLYLDYGTRPAVATELKPYTSQEIIRQLREQAGVDIFERQFVRGVYNQRLEDFSRGIYGDLKEADPTAYRVKEVDFLEKLISQEDEHVRLSLEHIFKGQKRQIVLFLDNVDQRPPQFQEEVFLIAASVAAHWPVTVFVSLRPETFALSRARGALAAYQPRVFTIEPPRVDLVIRKRLDFALDQLKNSGKLPGLPAGTTIASKSLENYLKMLIRAFDSQTEVIEFIDNMCAGNVREALNYVASFVGSGHVDSEKILSAMDRSGSYLLPLHEFLRAVIHGDSEHYDPSDSPILNIYDVTSNSKSEHFAMLLLLDYVERAGQVGGNHGFVQRDLVLEYMQSAGFSIAQTLPQVRRAFDKGLLSSPEGLKDEASDRIRITSAGAYSRKKLCTLFAYLDAVIVDTPIIDPGYRARLQSAYSIEDRLARSLSFLDYLDLCWQESPLLFGRLDWPSLAETSRRQIAEIQLKLGIA